MDRENFIKKRYKICAPFKKRYERVQVKRIWRPTAHCSVEKFREF